MANEIADWFNSIPFVTRYWFALSVIVPLLGRFGLLNPHWMILLWEPLFHKFQIWRPVTALFYFPLSPSSGFHYLINLFFLYNYSTRLESGTFLGRPADYIFMLVFCWLNLVIIGLLAQVMLLMDLMILAVLYVWCQLNRDQVVQFWFGTQFKAMYLPWVLLAFNMLLRGGGFTDVLGILVGHLYFFLAFKYPQDFGGPRWLNTPQIFYEYFPNQRGVQAGFGVPPTARRQGGDGGGGGHQWGRGHNLGGN